MIVEAAGGVLSSVIFDQIQATSDQEGLIIGTVRVQTENVISDEQIDNKNERIIYDVEKTVSCPSLRYFYDKAGHIIAERFGELVEAFQSKKVIGWYKSRQNTFLSMSLWEKRVHRHLCEYIQSSQPLNSARSHDVINPIFGLFTTEQNDTLSDRTVSKVFYGYNNNSRRWTPLKLKIGNLGNTTSYYKTLSPGAKHAACPEIMDKYRSELLDRESMDVGNTRQIDSLAQDMCSRLQDICSQVQRSEQEVDALEEEISLMKQILCATISHSLVDDDDDDEMAIDSDPEDVGMSSPSGATVTPSRTQDAARVSPITNKGNETETASLIDLSGYGADDNTTGSGPVVKCSTKSSDSFEHIDLISTNPMSASSKPRGDAFDFINDVMSTQSRQGKDRLQAPVQTNDSPLSGNSDGAPSPPHSPVY